MEFEDLLPRVLHTLFKTGFINDWVPSDVSNVPNASLLPKLTIVQGQGLG